MYLSGVGWGGKKAHDQSQRMIKDAYNQRVQEEKNERSERTAGRENTHDGIRMANAFVRFYVHVSQTFLEIVFYIYGI